MPLRTSSANHQASTPRISIATTMTGSTGQAMMPTTIKATSAIGRSSMEEATPPATHVRKAPISRNSCSHWLEERCSSASMGWRSMACISD
ncbi:hypothetical protein D3C72_1905930 [compost metagenome]